MKIAESLLSKISEDTLPDKYKDPKYADLVSTCRQYFHAWKRVGEFIKNYKGKLTGDVPGQKAVDAYMRDMKKKSKKLGNEDAYREILKSLGYGN